MTKIIKTVVIRTIFKYILAARHLLLETLRKGPNVWTTAVLYRLNFTPKDFP